MADRSHKSKRMQTAPEEEGPRTSNPKKAAKGAKGIKGAKGAKVPKKSKVSTSATVAEPPRSFQPPEPSPLSPSPLSPSPLSPPEAVHDTDDREKTVLLPPSESRAEDAAASTEGTSRGRVLTSCFCVEGVEPRHIVKLAIRPR